MPSHTVLTVSELTTTLRSILEDHFPFISVSGEISNLQRPRSGHLYFTLKDEGAQIRAVLFKMQQRYLAAQPKEGAQVLCRGRISVYEPRGEYQFIVDNLEESGAGALRLAFEQLKARLLAEGLFDQSLKRTMPPLPRHITLITSPNGAAVQDFIRIATRRYPPIHLAIYPVNVQGDQAAGEMICALAAINAGLSTDLIVLCRGGGSLEDLQAFNEENLARAIRTSRLPVVSAVGHEVDFTIADFAADLRAPTPSSAAELLLPDQQELLRRIAACGQTMTRAIEQRMDRERQRLRLIGQKLRFMPNRIEKLVFRIDELEHAMERVIKARLEGQQRRMERLALRLERHNPAHLPRIYGQRLQELNARLAQAIHAVFQSRQERLQRQAAVLEAVSPLATLARGYAVVRRATGPADARRDRKTLIMAASQVKVGEMLRLTLHQGSLQCRVEDRELAELPKEPPPSAGSSGSIDLLVD